MNPPDLYATDPNNWAFALMVGTGFASFLAALIRELFDIWGGDIGA